jgi:exodeoxyribonuclease V alpha subunit
MTDSSPQPRAPLEEIAGLVERFTFFNEESGFAVLRVKVRGQRELVTVLGSVPL